jgi:hypothetical protein
MMKQETEERWAVIEEGVVVGYVERITASKWAWWNDPPLFYDARDEARGRNRAKGFCTTRRDAEREVVSGASDAARRRRRLEQATVMP